MTTQLAAPAEALIIDGEGYKLTVTPEALAQKAELIESAGAITAVTSNEESAAAHAEVKRLASLRNLVEKSRKAVKEPVLKLGKEIDAKAAEFLLELEGHEKRLTKLIGDHAAEVARKQREEAAKAEAARREAERLELEKQRIERERLAAEEKARKEAEGKTGLDALQAEAEAEEAAAARAAEAKRIEEEAAAARARANADFAAASSAPKGVSMIPDFEVTDAAAFYAAFPELCELKVKRAETLARIKTYQTNHGKLPELPGVRVFETTKVTTR